MNFTVYKSSAGSGKTYTLVREYLKIALSGHPQNYRKILAVTFTNKAANEMKERVLRALKAFSFIDNHPSYKELFDDLCTQLNVSPELLKSKSGQVFTDILHNYAEFGISTIDKFTHKIVRTFAHDLRINVGFEVELDEVSLLSRAVDRLVASAGVVPGVSELLLDFTKKKVEEDKNWHIEQDLLEFAVVLLQEIDGDEVSKLGELEIETYFELRKTLNKQINAFKSPVVMLAEKVKNLLEEKGIEAEDLAGGKNGIAKYLDYLINFNWQKVKPTATVSKYIQEGKWASGKASQTTKQEIDNISDQLDEMLNEILSKVEDGYSRAFQYYLIERNILQVALLGQVEANLEAVKKEFNLIPISDLNKAISKVVAQQPVPFIYERIGEKYNHFLIDEFQDTSVLQWQNLLPLIENSLGSGNFNMLVGDAKQAIYRWRGGDVQQFVELPKIHQPLNEEIAAYQEEALKANYGEQFLNKNFRSKSSIVRFNNGLFSQIKEMLSGDLKLIYQAVEQEYNPKNEGGGVRIDLVDASDSSAFAQRNLELLEEHILSALNDGFTYQDIAVLCQKNSQGVMVAQHLTKLNIPIVSSESLLLSASERVDVIINLIHLVEDSSQINLSVRVLDYMKRNGFFIQDFHEYTIDFLSSDKSIFEVLQSMDVSLNEHILRQLPIYEMAEWIMRAFGWMEIADPFLQSLLDVILKYTSKYGNNSNEFLNWWEQKHGSFSIKVPEDTEAVTIMSVHKSKGLEFPVVIHPFANYRAKQRRNQMKWTAINDPMLEPLKSTLISVGTELKETAFEPIWQAEHDKTLLDIINVLYVALTRPTDRLYVISSIPAKNRSYRSVPDLLAIFYESEGFEAQQGTITFGEFAKNDAPEISLQKPMMFEYFESSDWKHKININYRSDLLWGEDVKDAKSYGNLVHEILAEIKTRDQVEFKLKKYELNGMLNRDEFIELKENIESLLSNPKIKSAYEDGVDVRNEVLVLSPDGKAQRPDRLAFEGDMVTIIDYKTGIQRNEHHQQVQDYAEILRKMNYTIKDAFLIYIGKENNIINVI